MNANNLADFMQGYFTCALWSTHDYSTPEGGEPLDANYDTTDIDANSVEGATHECADFINANMGLLQQYVEKMGNHPEYTAWERAGHDFWLNRNGHGAGYWDRGLRKLGDALSDAAHGYGSQDLYIGDDGRLYFAGFEGYSAPGDTEEPA